MHTVHLCVRVSQVRKVRDSDLGWEDMYREGEGDSWFDWVSLAPALYPDYTYTQVALQTTPLSFVLIVASFLNAIYLFTRIRIYRLHHHPEPISSPNARFVSEQLDFEPLKVPSLGSRVRSAVWFGFSCSWRFLLGFQLPPRSGQLPGKTARVQQLEVWSPGQFEMVLFTLYSPAHAFLWMATGTTNWMAMGIVMGLVGAQVSLVTDTVPLIADSG